MAYGRTVYNLLKKNTAWYGQKEGDFMDQGELISMVLFLSSVRLQKLKIYCTKLIFLEKYEIDGLKYR